MKMENSLGIVGGLGPLASAYFYELLTLRTKATKDQDHLNLVLLSHADTPDRTDYILDHSKPNPYPNLLEDCKTLASLGCKLISIPCNTANYFHDELQEEIKVPISNMIANTVTYIKKHNYHNVVIMATTGTIKANLYQQYLEKENINYILPNQDLVMSIIYDYVKTGKKVPKELWEQTIKSCGQADCFILGCTELSVLKKEFNLSEMFVDPLEIEADNILDFFHKERL